MSLKDKLEPLYTTDYYRMEKLMRNRRFQERILGLRTRYAEFGCPLPTGGFQKPEQYRKWFKGFRQACTTVKNGELARQIELIQKNQDLSKQEKTKRIAEVKEQLLPPLLSDFQDEIMRECGLDPENKKYQAFIKAHLFFGKQHLSEPFLTRVWRRNTKTNHMELFINLHPYTKKEHIAAFYDEIAREQKHLPGYVGKNKPWETFERDLHIYTVYNEVKAELPDQQIRDESGRHRLDEIAWSRLQKEDKKTFENMSFEQIRKAVSRVAKLDNPVTFKEMD